MPHKSRAQRCAEEHNLPLWRVLHKPKIALRAKPSKSAPVVDVAWAGDELVMTGETHEVWLRVAQVSWTDVADAPSEAWVLRDGTSVGLGQLLELVYQPGEVG